MIHMGYTEDEKKDEFTKQTNLLEDTPQYPYGLQISLRPEDVEKLGLSDKCDVGDKKTMMIQVEVKSIRKEDDYKGSENKKAMELQITDMMVKEKEQSPGDRMYAEQDPA